MELSDKLAFLLFSRDDKVDKKVKRHSPKMRIIITTKGLLGGKIRVIEGGTNFSVCQIKLEECPFSINS